MAKAISTPPSRNWRWLKYGLIGLFSLSIIGIIAAAIVWNHLFSGMPALPETETLWTTNREQAYEFRDVKGDLISVRGPHYGRVVQSSELAPHVPQAFIAAEDKRFYEHDGADTTAIARAIWSNWRSGRTVSGASTITQQVIKNLVLDSTQTYRRKAQEMRLAQELETRLTKEEILTLYLNRIYFGSSAYGISAAAQEYFAKPATELTLGEAALLATLPKAPSRFALDNNLEGARERQLYVLSEMVNAGFITEQEKEAALAEPVTLAEATSQAPEFGYLLDMVTERLGEILPDAPGDLVVSLTLDADLQRGAAELVTKNITEDGLPADATQAALILFHPDGGLAAMVGGLDYNVSQFNRATQAKRQPGSSFKTFVFAAALQAGIDPFSVYEDKEVEFGKWKPKNYTPGFYGPVTVSEAFALSLNTVAAQIGNEIGESRIVGLARSFGIISDLEPLPSIALGSQEVSLYELTSAYGTLAKAGNRLDPYFISRVEDSRGQTIYERTTKEPVLIYPAKLATKMNGMLARVVIDGTGGNAKIPGWTVAGKTGTSQDWRDAWFIGYTAELIGGVWVGNDDDTPMKRVSGGGLPAIIWADVMKLALADAEPKPLIGAEGIIIPSKAAEERITFYRGLAGAFGAVEQRGLPNATSSEADRQR